MGKKKTKRKQTGPSQQSSRRQNSVRLSQCMIVKNEEKNIEKALGWAKAVAFEQIVVDTGSADRTVELAEKLGAKVYHFEWVDDFSAARNYAQERATGDWIVVLDADEYISPQDAKKLMVILAQIHADPGQYARYKALSCKLINVDDDGRPRASLYTCRVFRNTPEVRYKGRIHEQLDITAADILRVEDITIIHTGYSESARTEKNKFERNIKMLRDELKREPDDMNIKAYLADSLSAGTDGDSRAEATELFSEVISKGGVVHSLLRIKAYNFLLHHYLDEAGRLSQCEEMCRKALEEFPGLLDFEYFMGCVLNNKGDYQAAWEILEKCEAKLSDAGYSDESIYIPSNPMLLYKQVMTAAQWM